MYICDALINVLYNWYCIYNLRNIFEQPPPEQPTRRASSVDAFRRASNALFSSFMSSSKPSVSENIVNNVDNTNSDENLNPIDEKELETS